VNGPTARILRAPILFIDVSLSRWRERWCSHRNLPWRTVAIGSMNDRGARSQRDLGVISADLGVPVGSEDEVKRPLAYRRRCEDEHLPNKASAE